MEKKTIKVVNISSQLVPKKDTKELGLVFFVMDENRNRYQYLSDGLQLGGSSKDWVDSNTQVLATIQRGDTIEIQYILNGAARNKYEEINQIHFVKDKSN